MYPLRGDQLLERVCRRYQTVRPGDTGRGFGQLRKWWPRRYCFEERVIPKVICAIKFPGCWQWKALFMWPPWYRTIVPALCTDVFSDWYRRVLAVGIRFPVCDREGSPSGSIDPGVFDSGSIRESGSRDPNPGKPQEEGRNSSMWLVRGRTEVGSHC